MWSLKVQYQKNNGFSLLELIIGIAIGSLLVTTLFSLLFTSIKISAMGELQDDIYLNGKYGIEYIKEELLSADKVICSSLIEGLDRDYPNNIGFVIVELKGDTYNFITYYLNDGELIRIARGKFTPTYPKSGDFSGFNQVCRGIIHMSNTKLDFQNNLIVLKLTLGHDSREIMELKSTIHLECSIDF